MSRDLATPGLPEVELAKPGLPGTGASLAEVLVALVILGLGGSLSTRLLVQATRELESAELGLRAALLLSELHGGGVDPAAGGAGRRAGPGWLVPEGDGDGVHVRFEPPGWGGGSTAAGGVRPGGYFQARSWSLAAEEPW